MAFEIPICCFVQRPLYLLWCTPASSTFMEPLTSFDSSLHKMFRHLLGPRSFDSLEGPLVHKETSLLITFNGVRLISTSTIAPTSYLGSWTLVALVIATRFMVDQRPFFLKTLAWVNNNIFPFQQHFKAACDLLPPPTHVCFPPFE